MVLSPKREECENDLSPKEDEGGNNLSPREEACGNDLFLRRKEIDRIFALPLEAVMIALPVSAILGFDGQLTGSHRN